MSNRLKRIVPLLVGLLGPLLASPADTTNTAGAGSVASEEGLPSSPEQQQTRLKEVRERRGQATTPSAETRQELSREPRSLSPLEREARFQELRKQHGLPTLNPEMQKRREELLKLSPEERRAKIQELRRSRPIPPVDEQVLAQRRAALQQKLEALRARKAAGQLSAEEAKLLGRLEQASRALDGVPAAPPQRIPLAPKK